METIERLSERFARFAQVECGASPLYRALAAGAAEDPRVLRVAQAAAADQPPANLLLGAVHLLLLRGGQHPLRAFYPSLGGDRFAADAYPAFADFVLTHAEAIEPLLRMRRVQTNEVARGAVLLPAAITAASQSRAGHLALLEVGASAGLLLLLDRYCYDYGDGIWAGDSESPVRIQCTALGGKPPPVDKGLPAIVRRIGIDLAPVDVRDEEQAQWLRALVWPDQPERAERLQRAIGIARAESPELRAGDGVSMIGNVLDQLPPHVTPLVIHAHTLNQLAPQRREAFDDLLRQASVGRTICRIGMEGSRMDAECRLTIYRDGVPEARLLAEYQSHGAWIHWR